MSSQKKSSRLEGKDLITIGIYTVIYVVIVMLVAMLGFIPVSYTHLDVYKRQVRDMLKKLPETTSPKISAKSKACLLYTSDVYKRQAFIRPFVEEQEREQPQPVTKPVAVYPAEKTHLPYDIESQTLHVLEPEHDPLSAEPAKPGHDKSNPLPPSHPVQIQMSVYSL